MRIGVTVAYAGVDITPGSNAPDATPFEFFQAEFVGATGVGMAHSVTLFRGVGRLLGEDANGGGYTNHTGTLGIVLEAVASNTTEHYAMLADTFGGAYAFIVHTVHKKGSSPPYPIEVTETNKQTGLSTTPTPTVTAFANTTTAAMITGTYPAAGDVCGCQSYRNDADKDTLSMCKASAGECSPLQSDGVCGSDHERCPIATAPTTAGTPAQASTTVTTTFIATTTTTTTATTTTTSGFTGRFQLAPNGPPDVIFVDHEYNCDMQVLALNQLLAVCPTEVGGEIKCDSQTLAYPLNTSIHDPTGSCSTTAAALSAAIKAYSGVQTEMACSFNGILYPSRPVEIARAAVITLNAMVESYMAGHFLDCVSTTTTTTTTTDTETSTTTTTSTTSTLTTITSTSATAASTTTTAVAVPTIPTTYSNTTPTPHYGNDVDGSTDGSSGSTVLGEPKKPLSGPMVAVIVLCVLVAIVAPLASVYCSALYNRWKRQRAYDLSGAGKGFSNPLAAPSVQAPNSVGSRGGMNRGGGGSGGGSGRQHQQHHQQQQTSPYSAATESFSNPAFGVEQATKAALQVYNFSGANDYDPQSHA